MAWNSYCRLLLAALLLTELPYLTAQSSGHLSIGSPAKISGARNESAQTRIPVAIDPGFHVNSNKPTDEYLIPLSLTWSATGALEAGAVIYPKPVMEKVADKPLAVFTGKFDLIANFKISANAPAGPGVAAGRLRYQACNSTTCFPPKTVDISVPYQIR
jgi:DsbC/DsbD-like thiol-disulfide interchange protein